MSKIDEKQIEQIIKQNVEKPDIKLTSQQILAMHNERLAQKPKKRSIFAMPQFKFSLGFLSAALVLGVTLYLSRDLITPPIISSEPPVVSETPTPNKVAGGKEGEFLFMSTSSLTLVPTESTLNPRLAPSHIFYPELTEPSLNPEPALDKTLPIVDDFYTAEKGYNYSRNGGSFNGNFGSYAREYIINSYTRIIANVELEIEDDETETNIDGEIIINDNHYRFSGETEVDLEDHETDISLRIDYNENSYLEINSENENDGQKFTYKLYENGNESLYVLIESYDFPTHGRHFVDVETKDIYGTYFFHIEKTGTGYEITYNNTIIHAVLSDDKYIYSYPNK